MVRLFRRFLLICLIRPLAWIVIGVEVHNRSNLPDQGPAIIAANHNSHVDTLLLMCLFPSHLLERVRPVAAADHFFRSPLSAWFATRIVGALPIERGTRSGRDVLKGCETALANNEILLVFPEGTRGEPEVMGVFKAGIARLAEQFPRAPIIPVYLQGAGRVLPRGARIPVPFTCSVIIGQTIEWCGSRTAFLDDLRSAIEALRETAPPLRWL